MMTNRVLAHLLPLIKTNPERRAFDCARVVDFGGSCVDATTEVEPPAADAGDAPTGLGGARIDVATGHYLVTVAEVSDPAEPEQSRMIHRDEIKLSKARLLADPGFKPAETRDHGRWPSVVQALHIMAHEPPGKGDLQVNLRYLEVCAAALRKIAKDHGAREATCALRRAADACVLEIDAEGVWARAIIAGVVSV